MWTAAHVYVRDKTSGPLEFHALGTPARVEVADVAARTRCAHREHPPSLRPPTRPGDAGCRARAPEPCEAEPGFAACYAAAAAARGASVSGEHAGQPQFRLLVWPYATA